MTRWDDTQPPIRTERPKLCYVCAKVPATHQLRDVPVCAECYRRWTR